MISRTRRTYAAVLTILLGVCVPTACWAADTKRPNPWDLWRQQIDQWVTQRKQMHSLSKQALKNIEPEFERHRQALHPEGCKELNITSHVTTSSRNVIFLPSDVTEIANVERDLDKASDRFLEQLKATRDNLDSLKASDNSDNTLASNLPEAKSQVDNLSREPGPFFAQNYRTVHDLLRSFYQMGMGRVICDVAALQVENERAGDAVHVEMQKVLEAKLDAQHERDTGKYNQLDVADDQAWQHCFEAVEASRDQLAPRFRALREQALKIRSDALQRMRKWREQCVNAKLFTGSGDAAVDAIYGQSSQLDGELTFSFWLGLRSCTRIYEDRIQRTEVKYPDLETEGAFRFVATQASNEVKEGVVPGAASDEAP